MDATILWKIRGYILLATTLTLGVFAGLGYFLDRYYHTTPKLLTIAVILSFPVANIVAIRLTKAYIPASRIKSSS